jgi:cell division protein FtsB
MEPHLMDDLIVRRPVGPPPLALRLAAVVSVPLLLYALVATGQKAVDNYRLNQEADGLRAEVVALRGENLVLQRKIEDARGDAAIEAIARQQLGLIKPGDHALVVADDRSPTIAPTPVAPERAPAPPPWRQWLDLFFG